MTWGSRCQLFCWGKFKSFCFYPEKVLSLLCPALHLIGTAKTNSCQERPKIISLHSEMASKASFPARNIKNRMHFMVEQGDNLGFRLKFQGLRRGSQGQFPMNARTRKSERTQIFVSPSKSVAREFVRNSIALHGTAVLHTFARGKFNLPHEHEPTQTASHWEKEIQAVNIMPRFSHRANTEGFSR